MIPSTIVWALIVGTLSVFALSNAPLSLTRRGAAALLAASLVAIFATVTLAVLATLVVVTACLVDATLARGRPKLDRTVASNLALGVPSPLTVDATLPGPGRARVRQPRVPDITVEPVEADASLVASLVPRRRGVHTLPAPAARVDGPLRLACWYRAAQEGAEVRVYPDLPAARALAAAVRQGRFRDEGVRRRGPLGLGTDFDLVRPYVPDDDVRQINWRATQRTGTPMSNQYRVEQDRDVIAVVDCGRLMDAPVGDRTRLDRALDTLCAVAYVADEVGDRFGLLAFDREVRAELAPRRSGARAAVDAVFDLDTTPEDSDYELAFRRVGGAKRAFVLLLTDLLDDAAADALLDAIPVLARRHAVTVASVADPGFIDRVVQSPGSPVDVYAASVALDVLAAQESVAARLRSLDVDVISAPPTRLAAACVSAYLRAKARARL